MLSGNPEVRLDTSLELLIEHRCKDHGAHVLATLVTTSGSTYRKPGARMLILGDGGFLGLLSGGCLESDLLAHAREVASSGLPRVIEYDLRGSDDLLFGMGAGCEGAMRVLLEPGSGESPAMGALEAAAQSTQAGQPAVLIMVHESHDLALGTHTPSPLTSSALLGAAQRALTDAVSRHVDVAVDGRRTRAFIQFIAPPPHLLICGAGPDARPVAAMARALGWRVSVVDHRPAYALPALFPGAEVLCAPPRELRRRVALAGCHAVVVMSHHLASDVAYLDELAQAGLPSYVGLLGPPSRRQRIAQELGASAARLRSRLRGPVGMDIGAVTPEGIALAIIGQIHAWLAGRAPRVESSAEMLNP